MSDPVDLVEIEEKWLRQCGACDAGMATSCVCPPGDPRNVISNLADEVLRLRIKIATIEDQALTTWSLPPEPGPGVTAVRATVPVYGFTLWRRRVPDWELTRNDGRGLTICPWLRLLERFGPLTDATEDGAP